MEAWGIEKRIFIIRGVKVMLDRDLAILYGVKTKELNKAVKPAIRSDFQPFMFRLTVGESSALRFQIGTSKIGRGGDRYAPTAFTEHGVAMLSGILNSDRAISGFNIVIMRTFTKLREWAVGHKELGEKLTELESKVQSHDKDIRELFQGLHEMASEPEAPRRRIGFKSEP